MNGTADFRTRFEKDPNNVKFLSKNLNQSKIKNFFVEIILKRLSHLISKVTGMKKGISLREIVEGPQLGDAVKKEDPQYDSNLVLPRLPFPNKFNGFSRYRRRDRSVESAYWDRVLPKLNEIWSQDNN